MKYKIYTDKEQKELLKNPFVKEIKYNRFIVYDNYFKLWAVFKKFKFPEKTSRQIFDEAGFNINIMNPKLPQARLKYWENLYHRYGYEYFLNDHDFCKLTDKIINLTENKKTNNNINKIKLKLKIYKELEKIIRGIDE